MVEQRKLIQKSINGTWESVPAVLHFPLDKSFGALGTKLNKNNNKSEHKAAKLGLQNKSRLFN